MLLDEADEPVDTITLAVLVYLIGLDAEVRPRVVATHG